MTPRKLSRPGVLVLTIALVMSAVESGASGVGSLGPFPGISRNSSPHRSMPNPDAPALKSFMSGDPAGTRLAAGQWPLNVRIGVVRVQFQPDNNHRTTGSGVWGDIPFFTFDDSRPGTIVQDMTIDSRAKIYVQRNILWASQYYRAVSRDKVILEVPDTLTDISAIYTMDHEMAEYGADDDYSLRTSRLAVDAIKAADAEMDYSKYDVIFVFHAGAGQHTDFVPDTPDDIHPVSINHHLLREILADGDPGYRGIATNDFNPDGSPHFVKYVEIFPETAVQDWDQTGNEQGALQGLLGVIVHEMGHYFGLPDLYDTFVGTRPTIGFYCLMATGFYNSVSRIPCHPSAWCKVLLGWEEPVVVNTDIRDIPLKAGALLGEGVRVIKVPITSTEYYLIENRLRDENFNDRFDFGERGGNNFPDILLDDYQLDDGRYAEFDWSIPNTLGLGLPDNMDSTSIARLGSGVLIWHIDEEVIRRKFARDLTLNFVNTESEHLGVALIEADGIRHMIEPFPASLDPGFGSPFDVFGGAVPGVKSLDRGNLNLVFGPRTNPSSRSYTGLPSNIEISGFRSVTVQPGAPVVDSLVAVDVRFNVVRDGRHIPHTLDGWPRITGGTTTKSSPLVINIDPRVPGADVVQATDDGRIYLALASGGGGIAVAMDDSLAGSPAAGDIDGDGFPDLVAATVRGTIYAWRLETGGSLTLLPGWPVRIPGRITATIVLADLNGDGALEVILGNRNGVTGSQLFAIEGDGSHMQGWPVNLDGEVGAGAAVLHGVSLAARALYVGTLDGRLLAFGNSGAKIFEANLGAPLETAPVVGRFGLPGVSETERVCAFARDGSIWSLDALDGTIAEGWPVRTGGSCLAGGAIGDVDGDGLNELVVPVDFSDNRDPGRQELHILKFNGANQTGYPVRITADELYADPGFFAAPVLADLDGRTGQEIILSTRSRLVAVYRADGSNRPWERYPVGSGAVAAPVPVDLDGDGLLDLLCADGEGFLYAWATGSERLGPQWAGLGNGPARTGASRVAQTAQAPVAGETLIDRLTYVYPNPLRGESARVVYQLGRDDVRRVTVSVLTSSGETVSRIEGGTVAAAGLPNEVVWEAGRYASGVYIVLIEAESAGGGTARLVRKLAVIK